MATPPAPTATLPIVRECRPGGLRPLLAPGGRDTYFLADLQRLLFGASEPIARFLPPAKWEMPERADRAHGGAVPRVSYTIPDEILKTATPLTTLPRAEIDALAEAITVFQQKARPDAKGVPPYTRQCHAEFRLPNPDLDPEAYWVYGGEFDRRLLILWGTEPQNGVSLPLDKALEKLRQREMSWRDKQELALKLALRPDEPLSKFLAPRSSDGGIVVAGEPIPPKKLKRLKEITPKAWRAFDDAAKAYYKKAHPDTPGIAPFERELRAEFRLPGYRQAGGDYYAHKGSFVIAIDAWPRESTLPLTEDPILKLPETGGVTATAAIPAGATVAAQLSPITKDPTWRYVAYAAAAVVVLGGIIAAVLMMPPSKPGELAKPNPIVWRKDIPDPTMIELNFTQKIDPASIAGRPAEDPAFSFANSDRLIVGTPKLSEDRKKVTLVLNKPLRDGESYSLTVSHLRGSNKRPFEPKNISVPFEYFDEIAPKITRVNKGNESNELFVFFSEPVRADSLVDRKFVLDVEAVGGTAPKLSTEKVAIEESFPEKNVVLMKVSSDLSGNTPYKLTVTGVRDLSKIDREKGNEIQQPAFAFKLEDKLPPRLLRVADQGRLFEIELQFSKAVDPERATNVANYKVTDPLGKEVKLVAGGITVDAKTGKNVTLKLQPTELSGGKYKVVVHEMADKDRKIEPAKGLEGSFTFKDADASGGPTIESAANERGSTRVIVTFKRGADPKTATEASRYRILDLGRFPKSSVSKVTHLGGNQYELTLARELSAGQYVIETNGITDAFGHKSTAPDYFNNFVYKAPPKIRQNAGIDWSTINPATYKNGVVTLSIGAQIKPESAENPDIYRFEPDVPKKVKSVKSTQDKTTIELTVTNWPQTPVRIEIDGLIVVDAEHYGEQVLRTIQVTPGM